MTHDPMGAIGGIFIYGIIIAFAGTALLVFIYLWYTNKLSFDETPKHQMLDEDI